MKFEITSLNQKEISMLARYAVTRFQDCLKQVADPTTAYATDFVDRILPMLEYVDRYGSLFGGRKSFPEWFAGLRLNASSFSVSERFALTQLALLALAPRDYLDGDIASHPIKLYLDSAIADLVQTFDGDPIFEVECYLNGYDNYLYRECVEAGFIDWDDQYRHVSETLSRYFGMKTFLGHHDWLVEGFQFGPIAAAGLLAAMWAPGAITALLPDELGKAHPVYAKAYDALRNYLVVNANEVIQSKELFADGFLGLILAQCFNEAWKLSDYFRDANQVLLRLTAEEELRTERARRIREATEAIDRQMAEEAKRGTQSV